MPTQELTKRWNELQARQEKLRLELGAKMMDVTSSVINAAAGKAIRPASRGFMEAVLLEADVSKLQPWLQKLPTEWVSTTEVILASPVELPALNRSVWRHVRLHGGFPPDDPSEAAWQNFLEVFTELSGQSFQPPYLRVYPKWQRYAGIGLGVAVVGAAVAVLSKSRNLEI